MSTLAGRSRTRHASQDHGQLVRLQNERRKLTGRLTKLDTEIARLKPARTNGRGPSIAALDRWLDELADGLPDLPPLPADFSRRDLYEDHD
jgi:hypothetical protein